MSRSRAASGLFAAASIVAASLLGAAPANAATLPTGATIDVTGTADGGINSVNPTTAAATLIGAPPLDNAVTAIDVNQSGQGFAISSGDGSSLHSANAVTGVISFIVFITFEGDPIGGCQGIDLGTTGVLTISCIRPVDGGLDSIIGTVNTTTGVLTEVATYFSADDEPVRALASNSAGVMYFVTEFGDIYTLDMTTGTFISTVSTDGRVLAADFDITDQLWVTIGVEGEDPPDPTNSLGTLNPLTGTLTPIAPYSSAIDPDFNTTSITVWGGTLSATGSPLQDALPIGLGAVLLLCAGVAIAVTHRISKRRVTPTQ